MRARAPPLAMDDDDRFPFTTEIPVRYRDLDTLEHVNNAVYSTYLEQARVEYLREVVEADGAEMVLAHVEMDFRAPVHLGDTVGVDVRVSDLGTSSFTFAYRVRVGDEVALTAESVQVSVDPDTGSSRPLPDDWRASIRAFEDETLSEI